MPSGGYVFTLHALFEMARRGLPEAVVREVLTAPDQRFEIRPGREVYQSIVELSGGTGRMKVAYDPQTDTLSVILRDDADVATSDEDKPGVILDYDAEGNLISLEILDASRRVTDARRVDFQLSE